MAAGLKYKWHGTFISVTTSWSGSSPSLTITGITNTDPPVVSVAAHGRSDGDIVRIQNVVGMTEVNGGVYVVSAPTAGTLELEGIDATGYGTYTSGGILDTAELSTWCELTGYNRTGGTAAEMDGTTICSDAVETETGLQDFGTTQLDYFLAPLQTIQVALKEAAKRGQTVGVKVALPEGGGTMVQLGSVQQTSEQAGNGTYWTASLTIRNKGLREDFE